MERLLVIPPDGPPREAPRDQLKALLADESAGSLWLDLEEPDNHEAVTLTEDFHFHRVAVEDALLDTLHPKVDDYGDYLYVVLHGIVQDTLDDPPRVDLQEIDFFLGKRFLVTHHDGPSASLNTVRARILRQPEFFKGPDDIFAACVEVMTDRYLPVIEAMDERIDSMEDEVFAGRVGTEVLERVFVFKRLTLRLRRTIHPQREVIRKLSAGEYRIVREDARISLRDVYDHLFTIAELIETYRDLLSGTLEAQLSVTSNRLNIVMKRLTVVTTVLMVIGTLAGIWGMNFEGIPGSKSPEGFYLMLGGMTISGLITVLVLYVLRWS